MSLYSILFFTQTEILFYSFLTASSPRYSFSFLSVVLNKGLESHGVATSQSHSNPFLFH